MNNAPENFPERRKRKKDWVVTTVSVISAVGWLSALAGLLFINGAMPEREDMFTRLYGLTVDTSWNADYLFISLMLIICSVVSCIVGFFFNMRRCRRKSDRYNKTIIVLGIISAIILTIFLINFWSELF